MNTSRKIALKLDLYELLMGHKKMFAILFRKEAQILEFLFFKQFDLVFFWFFLLNALC
jgi:hypothetical protein